jgi:glycosyltransferase involved in cell wall biosynthesis
MPQIFVFPWTNNNPYQNMLYIGARAEGWQIGKVRSVEGFAKIGAGDILHVHWTSQVTRQDTLRKARKAFKQFRSATLSALRRGAKLLWTVHNVIDYDSPYPEVEIALAQFLAENSWKIIQLNPNTKQAAAEFYELPEKKLVTLPQASYLGIYPPPPGREAAREQLGVEPDVPTVGFVGRMAPYKGIDILLGAMGQVAAKHTQATLLLAGMANARERKLIEGQTPRALKVANNFKRVPDERFPTWFAAADVLVFPYRHALNSSSALAAATFARPCILPGDSHLIALFAGQSWVGYFDPDNPISSLATAINDVLDNAGGDNDAALEFARSYTTYDMAWDFVNLIGDAR